MDQQTNEQGCDVMSVVVDDHGILHIPSQLERIPNDVIHLFRSVCLNLYDLDKKKGLYYNYFRQL